MSIAAEHINDGKRAERLQLMLEGIEATQGQRFALVVLDREHLIVATTNDGDTPTVHELRIVAAFAKAHIDAQVAYHLGYVRGLQDAELGDADERHDAAVVVATQASFAAADMTGAALAPFGVVRRPGDEGPITWVNKREEESNG